MTDSPIPKGKPNQQKQQQQAKPKTQQPKQPKTEEQLAQQKEMQKKAQEQKAQKQQQKPQQKPQQKSQGDQGQKQPHKPHEPKQQSQELSKSQSSKGSEWDILQKRKQFTKRQVVQLSVSQKQVTLFSHLPQYEKPSSVSLLSKFNESIHPAFVSLGLKYADRQIIGSTARVFALLDAFTAFIKDYKVPQDKIFALDIDSKMKPLIQFLTDCRPMSISMRNAVKAIKQAIGRTTHLTKEQAKVYILETINDYRRQKIMAACVLIFQKGSEKIVDGDVILTYGSSFIIQNILLTAHNAGTKFTVIIVDSNPKFEGKTLLGRLVEAGIPCTYILITALSFVINDCKKCFLGAHGLLSNGSVVSRTGSAVVAMMAHNHHIPVLICSETHKFHDRVQLDAICNNELENPDDLISVGSTKAIEDWRENPELTILNLAYDLIPMEFVDVVVTEVGLIPPTSVPVVLREAQQKSERQMAVI
jgi:translation initiation factor eIF-2B subunit delta